MARVAHHVLTLIPAAPATVSTAALAKAAELGRRDLVNVVCRLNKRGLVTSPKLGRYQRTAMGDQVAASGAEIKCGPPRPGIDAAGTPATRPVRPDIAEGRRSTLRDRLWHALRQERKSTLPELLELAARGSERDAEGNGRRYLAILVRFGIVGVLGRRAQGMAPTSPGFLKYVLVRDLGPRAPVYLGRMDSLLDRNAADAYIAAPKSNTP